jgi:ribose transport system ATP-binding protein
MGPNGAGKSTLLKILDGLYQADSGHFQVGDEPVRSLANRADVAFIHQDLGLIDALNISDNLRLGQPGKHRVGFLLDRRTEARLATVALQSVGLTVPVNTIVGDLSPAEKTLVAVARAFARGATTLFVDEATSTLTRQDARRVVDALHSLARNGAIVVFVTHKLSEVFEAAERVVVLIDGQVVADDPVSTLDRATLVRKLIASEQPSSQDREATEITTVADDAAPALWMRNACGGKAGPVTFAVRRGEVVGLTGLPGSGLYDVAYLACGAMPPSAGEVCWERDSRTGLIPPHRESQGGFTSMTVSHNLTISSLRRWRSRLGILSPQREKRAAEQTMHRLDVKPPDPNAEFGTLSGGNKQKVIFGRAIMSEPTTYILCEPTRGVDVSARAEIYRIIDQLRTDGAAILVATSDAEDLLTVCDRVGVVDNGRVTEPKPIHEIATQELEAFI